MARQAAAQALRRNADRQDPNGRLAIRLKDVHLERNESTLRGQTTKSGKTRPAPVSTQRLPAVIDWCRTGLNGKTRKDNGPLISKEVGEAIRRFRTAWEGTALRAHGHVPKKGKPLGNPKTSGLTRDARRVFASINLHWHLRHEYARRLAERGAPITKIQYLLSHGAVVTTERYIDTGLTIVPFPDDQILCSPADAKPFLCMAASGIGTGAERAGLCRRHASTSGSRSSCGISGATES